MAVVEKISVPSVVQVKLFSHNSLLKSNTSYQQRGGSYEGLQVYSYPGCCLADSQFCRGRALG